MQKDKHITKVIFLYERDSKTEVFAFFTKQDEHAKPGIHTSYAHVGQHSDCHVEYASQCRTAEPEAYAPLLKELDNIGYNVEAVETAEIGSTI